MTLKRSILPRAPAAAAALLDAWSAGRARAEAGQGVVLAPPAALSPIAKLRGAYQHIVERLVLTPYLDLELGAERRLGGEAGATVGEGPAYSSFVLLPILNLICERRLLFVGGAGRGKTSMAVLMGLLRGLPGAELTRSVQHGHPQLGVHELLGGPLPGVLARAEAPGELRVIWRRWLTQPVRIIDEYNRIPTKTQSALLSLMAEGYAELYEQTLELPPGAWYLTANDDLGGGTFPVIEALRDRVDVVVRSTPLHGRHLALLAERLAHDAADELLPPALILTSADHAALVQAVRAVPVPPELLALLGPLLAQLDFCRRASSELERMNKDTLHLSGRTVGQVCTEDCPLDKSQHACSQTTGGVSARAYQSLLHLAKALALFRGAPAVELCDLAALFPWVCFDRLRPNAQSGFFLAPETRHLLLDRAGWLAELFRRSLEQLAAHRAAAPDPAALEAAVERGPCSPALAQQVERRMTALLEEHELSAWVHQDLVLLKRLRARARGGAR